MKIKEEREQVVLVGIFQHNREIKHLMKILKEAAADDSNKN